MQTKRINAKQNGITHRTTMRLPEITKKQLDFIADQTSRIDGDGVLNIDSDTLIIIKLVAEKHKQLKGGI